MKNFSVAQIVGIVLAVIGIIVIWCGLLAGHKIKEKNRWTIALIGLGVAIIGTVLLLAYNNPNKTSGEKFGNLWNMGRVSIEVY